MINTRHPSSPQLDSAPPAPQKGEQTKLINTGPYPSHLPGIQSHQRRSADLAHSWPLRVNHTAPHKIAGYDNTTATPRPTSHSHGNPGPYALSRLCTWGLSTITAPRAGTATPSWPYHRNRYRWTLQGNTGFRDFIMFTDLNTRMTPVSLHHQRSDAERHLKSIVANFEPQFSVHAAKIRCDNPNEYLSRRLLQQFGARATALDPTTPTPLSKTAWLNAQTEGPCPESGQLFSPLKSKASCSNSPPPSA